MLKKPWISAFLILFALAAAVLARPTGTGRAYQTVYQTPTALADGRVIYVVQENDTCGRIQLLTGVTVEQLIALNKLDKDCSLTIGKELILTIITPTATITPNPLYTATPLLPTPTQIKGSGKVCIQIYDDANGNGFQEDTEALISGGVASITGQNNKVSESGKTNASEETPYCVEIPEGEYSISMGLPDGYNATTDTDLMVPVMAGNTGFVEFGAQISSKAVEEQVVAAATTTETPAGASNLLLAVLGGLLLLSGFGLGAYVLLMRRQ